MRLKRGFFQAEGSAATNWIQAGHRRGAVEYALAGINRHHDAVLEAFGPDPIMAELEGTMKAWVAETLLQGAFLREYHLWEKDCKAYFPAMAKRNGSSMVTLTKGKLPFTSRVWDALTLFSVAMPSEITSPIETMRERTNVMKHDAGLELEHFISEADYTAAITAIEGFWSYLMDAEEVGP
jgi:hypothetical protein